MRKKVEDSFSKGLRVVIIIGRCLGIVSKGHVFDKHATKIKITVPLLFPGFLITFFLIYAVLYIRFECGRVKIGIPTDEKLRDLTGTCYGLTVFLVYLYFFFATTKLQNIILKFKAINQQFSGSPFPLKFPKFCLLITVIHFTLGFGENLMFDVYTLFEHRTENPQENSTLEIYYKKLYFHLADLIPYQPVLTLVVLVLVKIGVLGWVYGDILAIILSKAITEKFRVLNDRINVLIRSKSSEHMITLAWDEIRKEFLSLVELTDEIQGFVTPLFLSCYGFNVHSIIVNLFSWTAPSSSYSFEHSFYVYFAFLQFLFRVMSVTYFAAEVHHVSRSILGVVQRCPNSLYSLSLARIEKAVAKNPVGICLFGTFMITRQFFVSILSFLFTTEIVLLQMSVADSAVRRTAFK